MKTIKLLLLGVLTLFCANIARADLVPDPNPSENRLTSITDGAQFYLRLEFKNANGENFDDYGYRWISLRTPYTVGNERVQVETGDGSLLTDAGIFAVEEIPDVEIQNENGDEFYQAYYIKNVKTGLYLCEGDISGTTCFLELTDDTSKALQWAFRPVTSLSGYAENQYLVNHFFVCTETSSGLRYLNAGSALHNGIYAVYYGTWMDACTWFDLIPPYEGTTDYTQKHVRLYTQAMTYGSMNSQGHYIIYSGFGGYETELANEYNEVMYDNTDDLIMKESKGEYIDWPGIIARLEALLLKLEKAELYYPEEGYYRIFNARDEWQEESERRAAYSMGNVAYWMTFEGFEKDPTFIWHITKKADGSYRIQNVGEGMLLTNCAGQGSGMSLSTNENAGCWIVSWDNNGKVNIRVGANDDAHNMHPLGHGSNGEGTEGAIIGWGNETPNSSAWRIVEANPEDYTPYIEEMNRKLEEAKEQYTFPPKDGYYRIISAYTQWIEEGHHRAVFADGEGVYWRKYLPEYEDDPEFIWYFKQNADGTYRIQNLKEGLLLTDCAGRNADMKLSTNEEPSAHIFDLGMGGQINISISADGNSNCFIHPKGHSGGNGEFGTICGFPGGLNEQSAWRLVPAADEEYAPYVAKMEERLEVARQFKPVQEELIALVKNIGENNKSAFEYELPASAIDVTPATYEDFWSNAAMLGGAETEEEQTHTYSWGTDGQGYKALIDDDVTTWFHTNYTSTIGNVRYSAYNLDGTPAEGAEATSLHNLAMKLKQPVSRVTFQINARNNNVYNSPAKIDLAVSKDGIHWTTICYGFDLFKTNEGNYEEPFLMGTFELGGSYQYVRFANYKNDRSGSAYFFCISELKVFDGAQLTPNCQASTMPQDVVTNFLKAYSEGNRYTLSNNFDEYNDMLTAKENLEAAYAAFSENFANPDKLWLAIFEGGDYVENYVEDDNIVGAYDGSIGIADLIMAVQDGIALTAKLNYTKDELAAAEKNIHDEIARVETSRVLPDPNKWYQIAFPTQQEFSENTDWNSQDAEYNVGNAGDMSLALYGRVAAIMDGNDSTPFENSDNLYENKGLALWCVHAETISSNPEVSFFRLVPCGDGRYALQNKATGLYISNLVHNGQTTLSSTPGIYELRFVGKGCTLLFSYDYWTDKPTSESMHFAWNGGNRVIGWGDTTIGSKSSLHVREIENGGEATQYFSAMSGVAQSLVRPNDIKKLEGADAYTPTGMYVGYDENDTPIYYVGLNRIEEEDGKLIAAGRPFIVIPEDNTFKAIVGTDLTKEAQSEHALYGTFQAKAMEKGTGFLKYNNETAENYLQVVGGAIQHNASAFTSYIKIESPDDLPEAEYSDEFDLLLPVRGTLLDTAIRKIDNLTNSQFDNSVYDLTGRQIINGTRFALGSSKKWSNGKLPKGIYIMNGKKLLVK